MLSAMILTAAAAITGWTDGARADTAAVIVMYHRFGESRYPSTNTTIEQFEEHIQELRSGPYTVLPVPQIIDALRRGKPLPDGAVGISIDDAFLSVYREGWPRLKKAGLPFTLFVATDAVDRNASGYMNWDQIRELQAAGVIIGNHTASHLHMTAVDETRNRDELVRSNKRFEEEIGKRPTLFAYPYGESSLAVQQLVEKIGLEAAFGQHSGAIGSGGGDFDLPRFAMNEKYGELSRFKLAVNTLPLPVTDITPADPLVGEINPPAIGFTLTEPLKGINRLDCFSSHAGRARIKRLGETRIEVQVDEAFPKGRTRVNCTFPAGGGRWRWFGRQFYKAN